MIRVNIKNKMIVIAGHANFDDYGKDIVCAAASAIVTTSVNAALRFDENSLKYKEEKDKFTIEILNNNASVQVVIENMISLLEELAATHKENIKILKEEN